MGAPTRFQQAAGISDTADALFNDYMAINQWMVEAGVVRTYCDEAGAAVDWLGDLGVQFHEELIFGGGEIVKLLGTSAWYAPGAAAAQMV
jgi:succinate dehydrogenase/fumarate reductase flavoprotein subunit